MSALARAGGKRHLVRSIGGGYYEISWQYEVKYAGSRLLYHRTVRRVTDRKGAERFARKWGVQAPADLAGK